MQKSLKSLKKNGRKYLERTVDDFTEIRDMSGKLLERREKNAGVIGYEDCEEVRRFDENGETSSSYINHETGEETHFEYGKNPEDKSYKTHIKDGVAVRQSHINSEDDPEWKNMQLEDIIFNAEQPDSTRVSFKYDENNQLSGIDIINNNLPEDSPRGFVKNDKVFLTHIPKKTSVDSSTVEALKSMLDGGARFGEDFDLKVEDGKLKLVPKIKNETGKETPELKGDAFERYKYLVSKGIHANEDFEVEYDKDGNFKYKMFNNQAREFDSTYKSEVYDKDGNFISSLTVRDNEVISEKMINGQKQVTKMSFEDAFMGLALEGDFSTAGEILGDADILAGGNDIYALADKYKQTTGHELVLDVFDAGEKVEDANLKAGITNLLSKLQPHGSVGGVGQDRKTAILENYKKGYEQFKEIRNFDPYKSQIADLLPKIQRIQHSENSFSGKNQQRQL